jgi:large subunit ribosomal protein L17
MRHKHGYRKLSRTSSHRKALLKNLAIALIENEKIETTLPKAKELRRYVEKLVTKARVNDLNIISFKNNKILFVLFNIIKKLGSRV